MIFFDILKLALRNLREAKLRVALTTMGVVVGVTVIVTMVSFGLGLQRNAVQRFKDLDLFNELTVSGLDISEIVAQVFNRGLPERQDRRAGVAQATNSGAREKAPQRVLDDAALAEIARIPGVEEVVVDERFLENFGYAKAADAVGQTIELLAPPGSERREEARAADAQSAQADKNERKQRAERANGERDE